MVKVPGSVINGIRLDHLNKARNIPIFQGADITLYEIHDADGSRGYMWALNSKRAFRIRAIKEISYQRAWTALAIRSIKFCCLPCERCGSRTIFKTEFILGWD